MDDVWNEVKDGGHHYEAYIPEGGFPDSVDGDSDRWIKMNLSDSQSGEYERTIHAYKLYRDSDGKVTGLGKEEKIRNMVSKRFERKGFAIPYILLREAKNRNIYIFILEVCDNDGSFLAEMVIPVEYALNHGRKLWESNSERQIFLPLDEWDVLECKNGWSRMVQNMDGDGLDDVNQLKIEDCVDTSKEGV